MLKENYLQERLTLLGYSNYQDYLSGKHWSNFRNSYTKSSLPQFCLICKQTNAFFNLHHLHYDSLGFEKFSDVIPLCSECHVKLHKLHDLTGTPLEKANKMKVPINYFSKGKTDLFSVLKAYSRLTGNKSGGTKENICNNKDYKKLVDNWEQIFNHLKDGYSISMTAEIYGITHSLLVKFLNKQNIPKKNGKIHPKFLRKPAKNVNV